jgi:spermidine synthase
MSVQSTSPYHAKEAFIAIGKTVNAANFSHVQQYHDNIPSFGEWGWTIAAKQGASPLTRLKKLDALQQKNFINKQNWLTLDMVKGAFDFPMQFYQNKSAVPINYLGSHAIYQLHQNAWRDQQGLNSAHLQ